MKDFRGKSCTPIVILLFLSSLCKSDDQLTHARPLSPGDTLVSKGGDFALGFYSPDSSNTSWYLGIWYHSIPGRTVVWTANRDNPIAAPSSPMLAITNSSDLVLSDSQDRTPWVVKSSITGTGVAAVLLDTGNFVLQSLNGTSIWQSFDHPTDTILPGRILLSKKGHVVWHLTASKGPNDLSTGVFSMSFDPSSNLELVIWNRTRPYRRSPMLNDVLAISTVYQTTVLSEAIISTGDVIYYDVSVSGGSQYAHITLDYMGALTLSLNNGSSWTTIASPAGCDLYASCGPFGYCDQTGAVRTCRCLDGFEPSGLNFSSGCRRTEALKCSKQSHFVTLPRMKLPDNFLCVKNRSFGECTTECSNDCSCIAYAYANLSTNNDAMADQSRCLVWTRELIDTGKYSTFGVNMYLRLADSPGTHQYEHTATLDIILP